MRNYNYLLKVLFGFIKENVFNLIYNYKLILVYTALTTKGLKVPTL